MAFQLLHPDTPSSYDIADLALAPGSFVYVEHEAMSVHYPVSASRPVVTREEFTGSTLTLNLVFTTYAAYTAFKNLRDLQVPVKLVSDQNSREWWLSLGSEMKVTIHDTRAANANNRLRKVSIDCVEVAEP